MKTFLAALTLAQTLIPPAFKLLLEVLMTKVLKNVILKKAWNADNTIMLPG